MEPMGDPPHAVDADLPEFYYAYHGHGSHPLFQNEKGKRRPCGDRDSYSGFADIGNSVKGDCYGTGDEFLIEQRNPCEADVLQIVRTLNSHPYYAES